MRPMFWEHYPVLCEACLNNEVLYPDCPLCMYYLLTVARWLLRLLCYCKSVIALRLVHMYMLLHLAECCSRFISTMPKGATEGEGL